MELQKRVRFQGMMSLVLTLGLLAGSSGFAQTCESVFFVPGAKLANFKNPFDQKEVLNIKGRILLDGKEVARSFKEALKREDVQAAIAAKKDSPYRIILEAAIPLSEGGGQLRLVTLNITQSNLAYNHLDMIALLKVNPLLANALGMYRVEGADNLAWVPDATQMNYRLKKLAQARGFAEPVFSYEAAQGIVDTVPYLKLLANGKFPFSSNSDVNLSIHDSMHAVAFAVLNGTASSRKVMEAAQSRNQVILKIYERIEKEMNPDLARNFIHGQAVKSLSPDSLERTMLMSFLVAGNYQYFSAFRATQQKRFTTKQNMQLTQKRIVELLKLYNYGGTSFKKTLLNLNANLNPESQQKMTEIFAQELQNLKSASENDMQQASVELMDFFSQGIFSSSAPKKGDVEPGNNIYPASGEN